MREKLAILGGEPLRKEPFPKPFFIDDKELNLIIKTVKNNCFSSYVGAARSDIEMILKLKSKDAFDYGLTYWNPLGGENVRRFEKDFAEYHSVDYAVAVNSATSGLSAVLGALNIEVGSEILVPSISFSATALSCLPFNCVPVFVDVDPRTYCISPDDLERRISSATAAIIVVHLLGNAVDMDKILKIAEKYNLPVIEDCAQSIGVKYKGRLTGTMGVAGVFSFQETKNIMTGEGGMIITNNPELAKKCRLIRNHGENAAAPDWTDEDLTSIIGFNFRMTDLQAAVGVEQMKKLPKILKVRKALAERYNKAFYRKKNIIIPFVPKGY
ncbi:MAG: DegT/DnrJ/EryC1/StrS family aminotransferase, partial [Armatimonadetes bacterium]|nr:DegT/DnrJ/EryC1/StrS family aminotransferase [Armatimonadota bacterium]